MLRDRVAYRIEEITLGEGVTALGATLRDARVRERYGMTVLAVRKNESTPWVYNPDAAEKIGPGMTLVVLGSPEQVNELKEATK
jgi:voltage-gated potassium channel